MYNDETLLKLDRRIVFLEQEVQRLTDLTERHSAENAASHYQRYALTKRVDLIEKRTKYVKQPLLTPTRLRNGRLYGRRN